MSKPSFYKLCFNNTLLYLTVHGIFFRVRNETILPMKKILTLLIAAGSFVTIHAQSGDEGRRVLLGNTKDNGKYYDRDVAWGKPTNEKYPVYSNDGRKDSREYQIDQVNREYDSKIYSIRNNRYLSNSEKERMIRGLERDRQDRINDINRPYNDYRRYNDNGKHKGWFKKNKHKHCENRERDRDDD